MCISFTFDMMDKTFNCECVASWLLYQPFDFINICNLVSLIIKVAEPETSDFRCVTDVEIIRTRIGSLSEMDLERNSLPQLRMFFL